MVSRLRTAAPEGAQHDTATRHHIMFHCPRDDIASVTLYGSSAHSTDYHPLPRPADAPDLMRRVYYLLTGFDTLPSTPVHSSFFTLRKALHSAGALISQTVGSSDRSDLARQLKLKRTSSGDTDRVEASESGRWVYLETYWLTTCLSI